MDGYSEVAPWVEHREIFDYLKFEQDICIEPIIMIPRQNTAHARNIGVMLDQNLNMEQEITTICKSAFFHIRNIRKVRKYLPQHAAETVVNALVTSRLDNCNALLFGLPKNLLQKLQYVQNSGREVRREGEKKS